MLIAKFMKGSGVMAAEIIEFTKLNGEILKHISSNGGETKSKVKSVPKEIKGYVKVNLID